MIHPFRRKQVVDEGKDLESDASSQQLPVRTTRRTNAKRHCARFWWIYLIVTIVVVLVVVLPVVYVAYPKRIRDFAHDPSYTVESISLYAPTPDSLQVNATASIPSTDGLTAHVSAFNVTATPQGSSIPLWTVPIPALSISGSSVDVHTVIPIPDIGPMESFAYTILHGGNVTNNLAGNMTIRYGALPTVHAPLTSTYTIGGVGSLGLGQLSDVDLLIAPAPDGAIVLANVTLVNPSVLAVELGTVAFNLSIGDTQAGLVLLPDLFYRPGNHSYEMRLIAEFVPFLDLVQRYCGRLPLTISGGNATYDGQDIPYYTGALSQINETTTFDLAARFSPTLLGAFLPEHCQNQTSGSSS